MITLTILLLGCGDHRGEEDRTIGGLYRADYDALIEEIRALSPLSTVEDSEAPSRQDWADETQALATMLSSAEFAFDLRPDGTFRAETVGWLKETPEVWSGRWTRRGDHLELISAEAESAGEAPWEFSVQEDGSLVTYWRFSVPPLPEGKFKIVLRKAAR